MTLEVMFNGRRRLIKLKTKIKTHEKKKEKDERHYAEI